MLLWLAAHMLIQPFSVPLQELIHRVRDVRQPLQQWTAGTFNGLEGIQVLNDDEGWTSSEDDEDDSASAAAPSDTATQTEVQTSMASNTMRT